MKHINEEEILKLYLRMLEIGKSKARLYLQFKRALLKGNEEEVRASLEGLSKALEEEERENNSALVAFRTLKRNPNLHKIKKKANAMAENEAERYQVSQVILEINSNMSLILMLLDAIYAFFKKNKDRLRKQRKIVNRLLQSKAAWFWFGTKEYNSRKDRLNLVVIFRETRRSLRVLVALYMKKEQRQIEEFIARFRKKRNAELISRTLAHSSMAIPGILTASVFTAILIAEWMHKYGIQMWEAYKKFEQLERSLDHAVSRNL